MAGQTQFPYSTLPPYLDRTAHAIYQQFPGTPLDAVHR